MCMCVCFLFLMFLSCVWGVFDFCSFGSSLIRTLVGSDGVCHLLLRLAFIEVWWFVEGLVWLCFQLGKLMLLLICCGSL